MYNSTVLTPRCIPDWHFRLVFLTVGTWLLMSECKQVDQCLTKKQYRGLVAVTTPKQHQTSQAISKLATSQCDRSHVTPASASEESVD